MFGIRFRDGEYNDWPKVAQWLATELKIINIIWHIFQSRRVQGGGVEGQLIVKPKKTKGK